MQLKLGEFLLYQKLVDYFYTKVNYFDLLKSKNKYDKNKINLGWCSFFPPSKNGTASVNFYLLRKLQERKDINLFLIPYEGMYNNKFYQARIDKRLFKNVYITKVEDSRLDLIVLFFLGECLRGVVDKIKVPFIIFQTIHNTIKEEGERKFFKDIRNYKYQKLFLTNEFAYHKYKEEGVKNVFYLPIGLDRDIFKPRKVKEDFTVLYISRLLEHKGIIPFLKSIPLVLKECPSIKFEVHSPFDGASFPSSETINLMNKIKIKYPNNFNCNIDWISYKNIGEVYNNASLLVFPSNFEGFGVPLIEAMGCGIPSIVLNKPPMNEIIKDGYTGYCLPLDEKIKDKFIELTQKSSYKYQDYIQWAFPSPEDIAQKIISLYKDKELYRIMSVNCLKEAEKFDLNLYIDNLIDYIKQSLINHRAR